MNKQLINHISTAFTERFSVNPIMIASPGRINLIGEHTEYNEGFEFPAAINKGIVSGIENSNTKFYTVVAYDLQASYDISLASIQPIEIGQWRIYTVGLG